MAYFGYILYLFIYAPPLLMVWSRADENESLSFNDRAPLMATWTFNSLHRGSSLIIYVFLVRFLSPLDSDYQLKRIARWSLLRWFACSAFDNNNDSSLRPAKVTKCWHKYQARHFIVRRREKKLFIQFSIRFKSINCHIHYDPRLCSFYGHYISSTKWTFNPISIVFKWL